MLVRLLVIALCAAVFVASELQCPGSGRFSTTPGICTAEYYTCNRDVNKGYTAYVLSCPGNTLFNERTRKCSSARTVSCVHSEPPGRIKVTTPTREKRTTELSSWIPRPTLEQKVDYRKPGRVPWGTPRPFTRTTLALTQAKPQKSQWRIRKSTTKKMIRTTSIKPALPVKVVIRTTHSPHRQKERATSKKVAYPVQKMTTTVRLSESPMYHHITAADMSSTTSSIQLLQHPTPLQENVNTTSSLVPDRISASTVTPVIQPIATRNIYTSLTQTTTSHTSTTVKMKPITCLCDQHKMQITPGYVTHPLIVSTSPRTFSIDNAYDTTSEVIIKNNQIPFMDSLESSQQSSDMEIVQVDFDPSAKKGINQKKIENTNQLKHIRYFYDPDMESPSHESLAREKTNPSRLPSKKNGQKIMAKKQRQPK